MGATPFQWNPVAPDVKRQRYPSMDGKSMKKPAFTLAFGCCWLFLDDEMARKESNSIYKCLIIKDNPDYIIDSCPHSCPLEDGECAWTVALVPGGNGGWQIAERGPTGIVHQT
jgi:hypothetical protein